MDPKPRVVVRVGGVVNGLSIARSAICFAKISIWQFSCASADRLTWNCTSWWA